MFARMMFASGEVKGGNYSDTRFDVLSPSITFRNDGRVTDSDGVTIGHWFSPPHSGIGGSYWVKFEQSFSDATYSGNALSTWHQISGEPFVRINAAPLGSSRSWGGSYIISDSAGGPTLGSGLLSLSSDRS